MIVELLGELQGGVAGGDEATTCGSNNSAVDTSITALLSVNHLNASGSTVVFSPRKRPFMTQCAIMQRITAESDANSIGKNEMNQPLGDMMREVAGQVGYVVRNMCVAVVVAGFSLMLSRVTRSFIQSRATFRELPIVGQTLTLNTISVVIGIAACTAILGLWGATWSAIAAGIGLSTLAIALGMQDVLKSIAGGAVIILERPFDIGDRIRIKDLTGEVVDVHVRHIVLRMDDGHIAMAPNGLLFTEPFENFSRTGDFAYAIIVGNIEHAPHEARNRINEVLAEIPHLHQTPEVILQLDLRRAVPWPLRQASSKDSWPPSGRRHRAVISWNSATEESAISEMVEKLRTLFPGSDVTVRRR
jgi:small conductance mechanosensitive channel